MNEKSKALSKNLQRKVTSSSKKLSWLLRHGALEAGVEVDAAGWALVSDVRRALSMSEELLTLSIEHNNKKRLEKRGAHIRACQGHSKSMQLSLDALEASWKVFDGQEPIYHATRSSVLESVLKEGLSARERTHVHLAKSVDSKVGKRSNVDVLLSISSALLRESGRTIFEAPNGVLLVRDVPPHCIEEAPKA